MRLTQRTDYALRVLMYCAFHQERATPPTIAEIAESHKVSRSHLMKVVMELSAFGWLSTTRGRGGGLRLLMPAEKIVIGEVVRKMEDDFTMVECFSVEGSACQIDGRCKLKNVLSDALAAYMAVLDSVTLEVLVKGSAKMVPIPMSFQKTSSKK